MANSLHSAAYSQMRNFVQRLTFGVSLGFRIYFSAFLILLVTSASYIFLYYFQQRQTFIVRDILNTRIVSMEAAQKIKESVVAYDNNIFRFAATKSEYDLDQSKELKHTALLELDRLQQLTRNQAVKSRLVLLRARLLAYFREADTLVQFAHKNDAPVPASLFQAASWARNQGNQREELSTLSTAGEQRLQNVFSLCDELITLNKAELANAQTQIESLRQRGQRLGRLVLQGSFAAVLLVAMALAISLIGPLRILMAGVRKVEMGQMDVELPITSSTEIGQLTSAFNRMARTIHTQREQLLRETITDNLTGVYNQRYFTKRLEQEFERSRRTEEPLSLMMIDVDHFKKYNDTMGHELGNVVLKSVAAAVRENLRSVDLLFRYGGDEFAVILPNADAQEASVIALRLGEAIRTFAFPGAEKGSGSRVTLSIGGCSYPKNAHSMQDLMAKADEALYAVKQAGRDNYRWNQELSTLANG